MQTFGYARVSTENQTLDGQLDALSSYGCDVIFSEKFTGTKDKRPELDRLLSQLRPGDKVVVTKLDRLGRSMKHLLSMIELFQSKGVEFVSLSDAIDTTSAAGRMMFQIMGAFAEFEANIISERTKTALKAAAKRGRKGGKPPLPAATIKKARAYYNEGTLSVTEICKLVGISRGSFYKHVKNNPIELKAVI